MREMQHRAQALSRDRPRRIRLRSLRESHLPAQRNSVCQEHHFPQDVVLRDVPDGFHEGGSYRETHSAGDRRYLQNAMAHVTPPSAIDRQYAAAIGALGDRDTRAKRLEHPAKPRVGGCSAIRVRCPCRRAWVGTSSFGMDKMALFQRSQGSPNRFSGRRFDGFGKNSHERRPSYRPHLSPRFGAGRHSFYHSLRHSFCHSLHGFILTWQPQFLAESLRPSTRRRKLRPRFGAMMAAGMDGPARPVAANHRTMERRSLQIEGGRGGARTPLDSRVRPSHSNLYDITHTALPRGGNSLCLGDKSSLFILSLLVCASATTFEPKKSYLAHIKLCDRRSSLSLDASVRQKRAKRGRPSF
jgi:hypothetical protein